MTRSEDGALMRGAGVEIVGRDASPRGVFTARGTSLLRVTSLRGVTTLGISTFFRGASEIVLCEGRTTADSLRPTGFGICTFLFTFTDCEGSIR